MTAFKLRHCLVLAGLMMVASGCAQADQTAAQPAPVTYDKGVACGAVRQVLDDVKLVMVPALGGVKDAEDGKRFLVEADRHVERLRTIDQADPELKSLLNRYADGLHQVASVLAANEAAAMETLDFDDMTAREEAVVGYCRPGQEGLPFSAEAKQVLTEVCAKVAAVEAGDGKRANELWESLRTGSLSGSAEATTKRELITLWRGIADAYHDQHFEISINLDELRAFRARFTRSGRVADRRPTCWSSPTVSPRRRSTWIKSRCAPSNAPFGTPASEGATRHTGSESLRDISGNPITSVSWRPRW